MHIASPAPVEMPVTSPRLLWGVVAVLAASSLALGATVLHLHAPSPVPASAEVAATEPVPVATAGSPAQNSVPKVPAAPANHAQTAPKTVANQGSMGATSAVRTAGTSPAPVCAHCGTVEAVTPVQREAKPSGVGVVAGAVLGGLVGNQVGGGSGKTLATIAGMVGGGWAGNTVEKRMKKETRYQVDVRMDDGSRRHIEQAGTATVGARVTVDGNAVHPLTQQSGETAAI